MWSGGRVILTTTFSLSVLIHLVNGNFSAGFRPTSLSLQFGESANVSLHISSPIPENLYFIFTYRDANQKYISNVDNLPVEPLPPLTVPPGEEGPFNITVITHKPGRVYLGLNETGGSPIIEDLDRVVCDVLVMHFRWLDVLQEVIGWIYFLAWSVSFYPQLILNCRRKSVVGLNFDFLCLNIIGFLVYSIFNLTFYFSPEIRAEYTRLYPLGVIPVMVNDIFFAVHAFALTVLTGIQVLIYERGGQRVSRVCIAIMFFMVIYCVINAILVGVNVITWLSFLYNLSYVKLASSLIKYIPQAIMNCRRKSTVGWSIENICLDLTGGVLSFLQIILVSYNFDDWVNGFSSPTKVGLGLFSILFDIFFMIQHWVLYPHRSRETDPVMESSQYGSIRSLPASYGDKKA